MLSLSQLMRPPALLREDSRLQAFPRHRDQLWLHVIFIFNHLQLLEIEPLLQGQRLEGRTPLALLPAQLRRGLERGQAREAASQLWV